jgi:hypothetical protein
MTATFTNKLGITSTTSPEQVEELLAIGLTEKEVLAILTGDFDGVDVEHVTAVLEAANREALN